METAIRGSGDYLHVTDHSPRRRRQQDCPPTGRRQIEQVAALNRNACLGQVGIPGAHRDRGRRPGRRRPRPGARPARELDLVVASVPQAADAA
ncbi:hypothetical protein HBB16_16865 [Pseudonocardia sp. MCCB 268]|nr:hypothetical protein [Pseudonocardia cytotoxica]